MQKALNAENLHIFLSQKSASGLRNFYQRLFLKTLIQNARESLVNDRHINDR